MVIIKYFIRLSLILLYIISSPIYAQIDVVINTPTLGDGMGNLQALLNANIGSAVSELVTVANDSLDKPAITGAFGSAAGLSRSLPVISSLPQSSRYSASLGGYGGIYSYSLDANEIKSDISSLTPEGDIEFGLSGQLLRTNFTVPMDFFIERLNLFTSLGYLNLTMDDYFIENLSITLAAGYTPIKDIKLHRNIKWKPLTLQGGISYGMNKIGVNIETGVITQEFDMDPDGAGPLLSETVTVELNPTLKMSLDTYIGTLNLSASSGGVFLDFIHLFFGGGINYTFGTTQISVDSNEDITVLGYLSNLIDEPGSISISGGVDGGSPVPLTGYIFSCIQFDISRTFINISALYFPDKGASAGVTFGVFY